MHPICLVAYTRDSNFQKKNPEVLHVGFLKGVLDLKTVASPVLSAVSWARGVPGSEGCPFSKLNTE